MPQVQRKKKPLRPRQIGQLLHPNGGEIVNV